MNLEKLEKAEKKAMSPYREAAVRPVVVETSIPRRRPRHYPIGIFMTAIQIRAFIIQRRALPMLVAIAITLVVALILARSA